jgi:DNA-binding response OmpR family regulator
MNSILLVDDEAAICAEFGRTLQILGFKVEVAPNVESGLARAKAPKFDAILVEFNVRPERGAHPRSGIGLKVIQQPRALGVTAPILMFTAMRGELYETASLDADPDDFIFKTNSIPSLIARLRAHIRRQEQAASDSAEPEKVST